jgi:hypothetical protein
MSDVLATSVVDAVGQLDFDDGFGFPEPAPPEPKEVARQATVQEAKTLVEPKAEPAKEPAPVESRGQREEVTYRDDAGAAPPAEPEAPAVDETLIRQAELYGYSRDEALNEDPNSLRRMLTAFDRKSAMEIRQRQQQEQANKPPEKVETKIEAKPEPTAPANFEKYSLKDLDSDHGFDETTISMLNGMNDHYAQMVGALKAELSQLAALKGVVDPLQQQFQSIQARHQADENARFVRDMDKFFDGLGDEFKDTFGKGAMEQIAAGSTAFKERSRLVDEMTTLMLADQSRGRVSSEDDYRLRALRVLHADKFESRAKLSKEVNDRRSQAIARPTGRQSPPRSNEDRAKTRIREFFQARGLPTDASQGDDEEF